jgi:hypothetical protein
MTNGGYVLIYGMKCNYKVAKKILAFLLKNANITDYQGVKKLCKEHEEKIQLSMVGDSWHELRFLFRSLSEDDEYFVSGITKFLKEMNADMQTQTKPDIIESVEDLDDDDNDSNDNNDNVDEIEGPQLDEDRADSEDSEVDTTPCHRPSRFDSYLDSLFNFLLRINGYDHMTINLKPCCYNDEEVFIGYYVGQKETIYGDEVYDYEDIDEFYEARTMGVTKLRNDFKEHESLVNSEMETLRQFLPVEHKMGTPKFYIFSDNCQGCT